MTYLHHLAARTLNQLPVVQPRLPSRFESVRREAAAEPVVPLEYATFTPSPPSIRAGAAAPASPPLTAEPARTIEPNLPVAHEVTSAPQPAWAAAPINPTVVLPTEIQRAAEADRVASRPPTEVVEHNTVTQVIEHDTETIITHHTSTEHTTLDQRTLIERERSAAPTVIAAPPPPRFAPQVTPYVPPAPERASLPEPAPIIQVSIGRIEVRAVQTPSSAPSAAPAPQHKVLSLDDYLHGVRT